MCSSDLPAVAAPVTPVTPMAPVSAPVAAPPAAEPAPPPPPTLEDARALTPEADFSRFVAPDVSPEVRNTALRQLFTDPHYNVMDGLDIYIEDYGRPDPLPAGMLRQMAQAAALGLFSDEPAPAPAPAPAPDAPLPAHEDPDLRLQPDDAAGRERPEPGAPEQPDGPR